MIVAIIWADGLMRWHYEINIQSMIVVLGTLVNLKFLFIVYPHTLVKQSLNWLESARNLLEKPTTQSKQHV
jgi:hypothetical protein